MGHYQVSKKARRRKVADLAAKSRKYSVNNNTIPVVENNTTTVEVDGVEYTVGKVLKWKNEKHPQPKRLRHAYKGYIQVKEDGKYVKKFVHLKSEYPQYKPFKFTREDLMEGLIQHKLKKWEKKHPRPIKDGQNDLFENQFIPQWEKARKEAEEHIRDVVVSMYHKLTVLGFRTNWWGYGGILRPIGYVKDYDMKGHCVLYPKLQGNEVLYEKALEVAQAAMDKDCTIIDADLMNHKETERRPLFPLKRSDKPLNIRPIRHKSHKKKSLKQAA